MLGTELLDNRRHHGSWNESIVLWKGPRLRSQKYTGSVSSSALSGCMTLGQFLTTLNLGVWPT